jgi:hypothetical protein
LGGRRAHLYVNRRNKPPANRPEEEAVMSTPHIKTAVPKRRYQYGEFMVTVLGEVESDDPVEYRWIFAVATETNPQPNLFLTAEREGLGDREYTLRVSMADGEQVLGRSERWRDLDAFVEGAMEIIGRMLELGDETPHRLM